MVLLVAVGALDVVSDKVPASNNLANQEEGVSLSSDQTGLQVLILGDVLPCVGRTGRLDKLEGSLLGRLDLSTRGRGHTLTDVDLLGNLTSDLGVVDNGAYYIMQQRRKRVVRKVGKGNSFQGVLSAPWAEAILSS